MSIKNFEKKKIKTFNQINWTKMRLKLSDLETKANLTCSVTWADNGTFFLLKLNLRKWAPAQNIFSFESF